MNVISQNYDVLVLEEITTLEKWVATIIQKWK